MTYSYDNYGTDDYPAETEIIYYDRQAGNTTPRPEGPVIIEEVEALRLGWTMEITVYYRPADQVLHALQDRAADILEGQQAMPDDGAVRVLREIVRQAWEHKDRWTAEGR